MMDPETGQPSNATNAISADLYFKRQMVDPITGQVSNEENAVRRYNYYKFKNLVHDGEKIITKDLFCKRQLLDPDTRKPSNGPNAKSRTALHKQDAEKRKKASKSATCLQKITRGYLVRKTFKERYALVNRPNGNHISKK